MKFIIDEEYDIISKLNNETLEELTYLDIRTVKTLEEAKTKNWYKDWYNNGINHREENGNIICERKNRYFKRVININSLEELIQLQERLGEIKIGNYPYYLGINKYISIDHY
jgi:GTP:adenosylcobinamide-phosphate guanylyltransferase